MNARLYTVTESQINSLLQLDMWDSVTTESINEQEIQSLYTTKQLTSPFSIDTFDINLEINQKKNSLWLYGDFFFNDIEADLNQKLQQNLQIYSFTFSTLCDYIRESNEILAIESRDTESPKQDILQGENIPISICKINNTYGDTIGSIIVEPPEFTIRKVDESTIQTYRKHLFRDIEKLIQ